jgi:uncharacterized protein
MMGMVQQQAAAQPRTWTLYDGRTQCRVSTHLLNVMPNGKIFPART